VVCRDDANFICLSLITNIHMNYKLSNKSGNKALVFLMTSISIWIAFMLELSLRAGMTTDQ